jgi:hypothetical protein
MNYPGNSLQIRQKLYRLPIAAKHTCNVSCLAKADLDQKIAARLQEIGRLSN